MAATALPWPDRPEIYLGAAEGDNAGPVASPPSAAMGARPLVLMAQVLAALVVLMVVVDTVSYLFSPWFASSRRWSPFSSPQHRISDLDLALRLPALDFANSRSYREYYGSAAAAEFCAAHGFPVFKPRPPVPPPPGSEPGSGFDFGRRKVYDLFMVNSELDFLEIRLETLYEHVDYFVIVESPRTFQGRPKELNVLHNWDKLKRFHDKIIYHLLDFPPDFAPKLTWDFEDLQRDAALVQVLHRLEGSRAPAEGDVLMVGDVDEIPRPVTVLLLRTCSFPRRLTVASKFYYYSYQFRHKGGEWPHPQATFYAGNKTLRPSELRSGRLIYRLLGGGAEAATLANAGWHCSSCFGTIDEFLNKMASFSHMWMNEDKYRDRARIAGAVREGRDVWDRRSEVFERIDENTDLPEVLLADMGRKKFSYMLSRDGQSAGFSDYP